jgi:hypothetical protein
MNEFQATAVLVALFALRCVLPFILLLAIGYGMNRLVDHWERDEKRQGGKQMAIPLAMAARPAERSPQSKIPCWVFNHCEEKTRDACPAYANPSLACWVARLRAEGQLPGKCARCPLYSSAPAFAVGD